MALIAIHTEMTSPTDISISFSSPEYTGRESDGAVEVCVVTSTVLSQPATVVLLALENLPVDARGKYITVHCTHQ